MNTQPATASRTSQRIYPPHIPWWYASAIWVCLPLLLMLPLVLLLDNPLYTALFLVGTQSPWIGQLLFQLCGPTTQIHTDGERFRLRSRRHVLQPWDVLEAPWSAVSTIVYESDEWRGQKQYIRHRCTLTVTPPGRSIELPMSRDVAYRDFMAALDLHTPHLPYRWAPIPYTRRWTPPRGRRSDPRITRWGQQTGIWPVMTAYFERVPRRSPEESQQSKGPRHRPGRA